MWCNSLVIILLLSNYANSYKILGYFPMPSVSHQVIYQPIWKELSLRGHQITVITPNPLKDSTLVNLTEIDVGHIYKELPNIINFEERRRTQHLFNNPITINSFVHKFEEIILRSVPVQNLIHSNEDFDLVITETFFSLVGYSWGARFNASVVGISSLSGFINTLDAIGNPSHPALTANFLTDLGGKMTFTDRLKNVLFNVWYRVYYDWVVTPKSNELGKKYFGNDLPQLELLQSNLKLLLVNSNPILNYVRPNVPGVIEIGQMHIKQKKPLPEKIKNYLDNSKRGVIYFSLGSNVKSSNSSEVFINTVQQALSELPYDVMWKWETDSMPNKPRNVLTQKWFPQQDLLGHPNVKAFVTQGGLQSMEEAITNGVPLIVIPFMGDQQYNARRLEQMKVAKRVNVNSLTKDELKNAITEVIENEMYKKNMLKYRSLLLDQPMTGLEKAVWWIEYVLRHNGDVELTLPAANQMPYYQYFLLDVISFLTLILVAVLTLIVFISKFLYKLVFKTNSVKVKKH